MKTDTMKLETSYGATTAHVASPDAEANAAVILIQEWWGIDDHIRDLAGRYAREGYLCVAPDLYRGAVTKDPQEASKLMHNLELEDGMATIKQTVEELRNTRGIERIGITGYCMGGIYALRAACLIETLGASAAFYGDIPEEDVLAKMKVPTLFFAGARDQWITPEKVEGLKEVARKYDLPLEVVSYDADHAFFNDTRPEVYDATAAQDAWRRILELFDTRLRA
ncbi:MAG: dienelactone hydrolase family protein [Acidobacteria bacterium]|nr:dienelactone hydrolase family protein [Acidobacteriota bacterium]